MNAADTRYRITYLPRDFARSRTRVFMHNGNPLRGYTVEVDLQGELFSDSETGVATPRTVEVVVVAGGSVYLVPDVDPALWTAAALGWATGEVEHGDFARAPRAVAFLMGDGEWVCSADDLALDVLSAERCNHRPI